MSSWPLNSSVCGAWPMAMKTPSIGTCTVSRRSSVLLSLAPVTERGSSCAQHLVELVVPHDVDLLVGEQALLQDLLGAEHAAAMHEDHLAGDVGEIQRLLDRRVAAADHDHFLAAVEEAVAGGAGRDAIALEAVARTAARASAPARRWR